MGALTNYFENLLLNHTLRAQAWTPPATIYVGLFTVAPGEAGGGTEVSGGGYARQAVTFAAASGGSCSNSADVTFPIATANWGTIVAIALFDAVTGGNMLYYGTLSTQKTVNSGDQVKIPAGQLTVSLD